MFPQRKTLPHETPDWVKAGALYFVTICCRERHTNSLAHDVTAKQILDSALHLMEIGRWHVRLLVLMPDHLHTLIVVPQEESLASTIRDWKHFVAKHAGIEWQRGYFDHRILNGESLDEKAAYIRANPVRAGLVARSEDWPYQWEPKR